MFEIKQNHGPGHSLPYIEAHGLSVEQCQMVRSAVCCNNARSHWYSPSHKAGAFLQGYDEKHGWVLVEFWREEFDVFVGMLNDEFKQID